MGRWDDRIEQWLLHGVEEPSEAVRIRAMRMASILAWRYTGRRAMTQAEVAESASAFGQRHYSPQWVSANEQKALCMLRHPSRNHLLLSPQRAPTRLLIAVFGEYLLDYLGESGNEA